MSDTTTTTERRWNDILIERGGRPVRIPHADIPGLADEYRRGTATIAEMAARYNVTPSAIYLRLKPTGVLRHPFPLTIDDRLSIRQAYRDGKMAISEIASTYRIGHKTLYNIISDMPRRPPLQRPIRQAIAPMPCPLSSRDYVAMALLPCVTNAQVATDRRAFLAARDLAAWEATLASDPTIRSEYERCVTEYRRGAMQHADAVAA